MKKQQIIVELYNLREELLEVKKQEIINNLDQNTEKRFETEYIEKPKVKVLKKKLHGKQIPIV
jgi:hypothetical protein